jgi:hypothetical protein
MKTFSVKVRLESGQQIAVTIAAWSSTEARAAARQMFPGCAVLWVEQL